MTVADLRLEDLPAWMRPRRRTIDWGLLIVLTFSLLAVGPLALRHSLSFSTEAEMVELRSVEVARLVRAGILFSRWAPDLNYGLGSPLFNFLAPLPHYLPGYHQVITDTSPVDSINLFLALSIVAAGSGMYLFAAQRWGAAAGLVAGLVYLFSPPITLVLPYLRGDLGALMALGLLPWALWAIDQLYLVPTRLNLLLTVAMLSALILSDSRLAFIGLFVVATTVVSQRRLPGTYRYVVDALFAASLLTAFFWLPALVERQDIRWQAAQPDEWTSTIAPAELFGVMSSAELSMLNPPPFRGVGIGTWMIALAGATALLVRRKPWDMALFLALGSALLILSTPPFYSLWPSADSFLPLLPYHAVLVAIFCLSVVAAQAPSWLEMLRPRWRPVALSSLCLVMPLIALPTLVVPMQSATASSEAPDYLIGLQHELRGYHTGTFRDGLLLPGTSPVLPAPLPNLLRDVQAQTFDRISRRSFSAESQINSVEHSPLYNRYIFDLSQPTSLEFNILYFPGWNANIDGKPWEVQPTESGLLRVKIPQFSGELVVLFEGTATRNLGWLLVAAGCAAMLLALRRIRSASEQDGSAPRLSRPETVGPGIALVVYAALLIIANRQPQMSSVPGGQPVLGSGPLALKNGVTAVGYMLTPDRVRAGGQVTVTLFWQATQAVTENYQAEIALWDSVSGRVAAAVHRHPGEIPTSRWLPGGLVRDEFRLTIPPDAPPGSYAIQVAIRACDSLTPLPCPSASRPSMENDPDADVLPERIHVISP